MASRHEFTATRTRPVLLVAGLAAALLLGACQPQQSQEGTGEKAASDVRKAEVNPAKLDFPALPDFQPPQGERIELDNGLVIYLLEDHELPQVMALARVGAGQAYEPEAKRGLASLTSTVLRTGGAGERGPDEVNELLEGLGATISTGMSEDHATVYMRTLTDSMDTVLSVYADVLMRPQFAAEKVELAKSRSKSAIARRNDQPQQIAFREFGKLIHGADSPYAWHPEYYTLDRIERADLEGFYGDNFHPNNTQISVWGDFDAEAMADRLREHLGGWARAEDYEAPKLPPVDAEPKASVNLIEKTDVTQSTILVGHPGEIQRNHDDYAAVEIMNEVLSGGFSGRLFKRVRSDQGLAYSVFGNYSAPYHRTGRFFAGVFTKSGTTVEAAQSVLTEVEKMRQEPPTEEELGLAKDAYLNSMVFRLDSLRQILDRRMTYTAYGYPEDFLTQLKADIEAVTAEDVQRVAEKYLHPDSMHLLVVGNPAEFSEDLSTLGEVNEIDITIPTQPPGEQAEEQAASAEDQAAGRELLAKARESLGGDAFDAIEAIQSKGGQQLKTPQGTFQIGMNALIAFPDRMRIVQKLPMGEITMVINGDQGTMQSPQGSQPMPERVRQEVRSQLWRDLVYLFARMDAEGMEVSAAGEKEVDGSTYKAVRVNPPEAKAFTLLLDPETHRPQRMEFQGTTMQGAPVESVSVFGDYQAVEGIEVPYTSTVFQDGEQSAKSTLNAITLNPEIEEGAFKIEQEGGEE